MDERAIRASDAEREAVADRLREHMLEGRLTSDELDERTGAAWAAVTVGDLALLTRDLPAPPRPAAPTGPPVFVRPEDVDPFATPYALSPGPPRLGLGSSTAMTISIVSLGMLFVSAGLLSFVTLPTSLWAAREGRRERRPDGGGNDPSRTATALGVIGAALSVVLALVWLQLFT